MNKKLMVMATLLLMLSCLAVPVSALEINMEGVGYVKVETQMTGGSTLNDLVEINAWYYDLDMDINTGSYMIDRTVTVPGTHGLPYEDRTVSRDSPPAEILFSTTYKGSEELTVTALLKIDSKTQDYTEGGLSQTLTAGTSMLTQLIADASKSYNEFDVEFFGIDENSDGFYYSAFHYGGGRRFLDVVDMSASIPTLDFSGFGAGGDFGLSGSADFTMEVNGTVAGDGNSANPDRSTRIVGAIGYYPPADGYTGAEINMYTSLFDLDISGIPHSGSDTSTRERYPYLEDMFGFTITEYVPPPSP